MKRSIKDKAKGAFREMKGRVKQAVGRAANKPRLEVEGQAERIGGKIQKKIGKVERILGA
jgi:uncharacterized protein YjbJ (UPF0337 family)